MGSIPFTAPRLRTEGFSPQGLLEKVFCPLVTHCQICLLGRITAAAAGEGGPADTARMGAGTLTAAGTGSGIALIA